MRLHCWVTAEPEVTSVEQGSCVELILLGLFECCRVDYCNINPNYILTLYEAFTTGTVIVRDIRQRCRY